MRSRVADRALATFMLTALALAVGTSVVPGADCARPTLTLDLDNAETASDQVSALTNDFPAKVEWSEDGANWGTATHQDGPFVSVHFLLEDPNSFQKFCNDLVDELAAMAKDPELEALEQEVNQRIEDAQALARGGDEEWFPDCGKPAGQLDLDGAVPPTPLVAAIAQADLPQDCGQLARKFMDWQEKWDSGPKNSAVNWFVMMPRCCFGSLRKGTEEIHGTQRPDGMIWSDTHGNWVSPEIFFSDAVADMKEQYEWQLRQKERAAEWKAYWEKNRDKTFSEKLESLADEYARAKRSAENTDYGRSLVDEARSSGYLDADRLEALARTMEKGLDKGFTREQLRSIVKGYYGMAMAEHEAVAALQEIEEARYAYYEEVSRNSAKVLAMYVSFHMPMIGAVVEGITSGALDGQDEGIKVFLRSAFPVNTAEAVADGAGFGGILLGMLADMGAVSDGARGAMGITEHLQKSAKFRKAFRGKVVQDVADAADVRRAYLRGQKDGLDTADTFRRYRPEVYDPEIAKDMVVQIQKNKYAIDALNYGDIHTIDRFNKQLDLLVYQPSFDRTRRRLAKQLGLNPADIKPKMFTGNTDLTELGMTRKAGQDLDVAFMDTTKRLSREIDPKTGKRIELPPRQIDPKHAESIYQEELYRTVHGTEGLNKASGAEVKRLYKDMDQNVTWQFHAESFGASEADFNVLMKHAGDLEHTLPDPGQIGLVLDHKSQEFFDHARDLTKKGDIIKAQRFDYEGMRQTIKTYERYYSKRFEALKKRYPKRFTDPPPEVSQAIEIMKQVGAGKGKSLSPGEARILMNNMGTSPEKVTEIIATQCVTLYSKIN